MVKYRPPPCHFKRGESMNKNSPSKRKKAVIMAVVDALSPIMQAGFFPPNMQEESIKEALFILSVYPYSYKQRLTIRKNTPDYCAAIVENILHLCLLGTPPPMAFNTVFEVLDMGLKLLQETQIKCR